MRRSALSASFTVLLAVTLAAPIGRAETLVIESDRDATLFEDATGSRAAGAGATLFAGRTAQPRDSVRRALLHFDVAGGLPPDAVVLSARLVLHVEATNPGARDMALHRVQSDWGEGGSFGGGGGGAPAASGDATWLHTFFPQVAWRHPGGDWIGRASASTRVSGTGAHAWEHAKMVNDVRLWQHAPHRNFGWALVGDESSARTTRRFTSRESAMLPRRPRLEIEYTIAVDAPHLPPRRP